MNKLNSNIETWLLTPAPSFMSTWFIICRCCTMLLISTPTDLIFQLRLAPFSGRNSLCCLQKLFLLSAMRSWCYHHAGPNSRLLLYTLDGPSQCATVRSGGWHNADILRYHYRLTCLQNGFKDCRCCMLQQWILGKPTRLTCSSLAKLGQGSLPAEPAAELPAGPAAQLHSCRLSLRLHIRQQGLLLGCISLSHLHHFGSFLLPCLFSMIRFQAEKDQTLISHSAPAQVLTGSPMQL